MRPRRRLLGTLGLLALVFAPGAAAGADEGAVEAAFLAPTFTSAELTRSVDPTPAPAAAVAPRAPTAVTVTAVALTLVAVATRRRRLPVQIGADLLLVSALRRRGPPLLPA